MKLATYRPSGGRASLGVITNDLQSIIDITQDFSDMLGLIDAGDAGLETARKRLSDGSNAVPLASVQLLAPIPVPRQFRDFNNHPQHMRDAPQGGAKLRARLAGLPPPAPLDVSNFKVPQVYLQQPIFYITNRFSINGPDANVQRPSYSENLDYELELAIVLGRGGKNIPEASARDYIFGYTIFNDFSARDQQMAEMEGRLGPAKGKSFDGGNVLGPWIVTKDEIPEPFSLTVVVRVNGKTQGTNTGKEMIHSFERMISFVSKDETLHPGEVFGSGTYGGCCGMEIDYFLKDGDVVELEIEGIGVLRNRIIPANK
jgi:2-keto-4-pentenoate hydratase/2-oxohepta-3-ene-1,7-dioic acid hydratase in catechol pathway